MNLLHIWKKQILALTSAESRAVFILSFTKNVKLWFSQAYTFVPMLLVFSFFSAWQPAAYGIGTLWFLCMLLFFRPSVYKKDKTYLKNITQEIWLLIFVWVAASFCFRFLPLSYIFFPIFLSSVGFFLLLFVDTAERVESVVQQIKNAAYLYVYNIPLMIPFCGFLSFMFVLVNYIPHRGEMILWRGILAHFSFLLILMFAANLLCILYTISIYEHENELF